jgi:hypothetical protein
MGAEFQDDGFLSNCTKHIREWLRVEEDLVAI